MKTIDYLAIPYDKMNCYEIVKYFYKQEYDIDIVDVSGIKDDDHRKIHKEILKQSNSFTLTNTPKLGCIVLMNNSDHHSVINHIGIYIGVDRILHTSKKTGCVISKPSMLNIKGYAIHPNLI